MHVARDRLEGADPKAFCDEHYGTQRIVYALAVLRSVGLTAIQTSDGARITLRVTTR